MRHVGSTIPALWLDPGLSSESSVDEQHSAIMSAIDSIATTVARTPAGLRQLHCSRVNPANMLFPDDSYRVGLFAIFAILALITGTARSADLLVLVPTGEGGLPEAAPIKRPRNCGKSF